MVPGNSSVTEDAVIRSSRQQANAPLLTGYVTLLPDVSASLKSRDRCLEEDYQMYLPCGAEEWCILMVVVRIREGRRSLWCRKHTHICMYLCRSSLKKTLLFSLFDQIQYLAWTFLTLFI